MSMLITMGSAILAERSKEIFPIGVKDVYSLDFGKCKDVYERISKEEGGFSIQFKKALEDRKLKKRYEEYQILNELFEIAVGNSENATSNPMQKMYQKSIFRMERLFDCFRDMDIQADPFL